MRRRKLHRRLAMPSTRNGLLVIVPCSKAKIWARNFLAGPTSAKDTYISPLFRLHRRYAEAFATEWRILSAHYGFLHPDQFIEDYDATFRAEDLHPKNWWRLDGLFQHAHRFMPRCERVILLGGVLYRQIARRSLQGIYLPHEICEPFRGHDLLRTMHALKNVLNRGTDPAYSHLPRWAAPLCQAQTRLMQGHSSGPVAPQAVPTMTGSQEWTVRH